MAIIKCKMCGGDMSLSSDKTVGICEYCGTTMTLPKVDDDQRAASFNRGNHFRRNGEFDKALAVYEHIVQEDDTDAEAHWCCALCRFGIEYVEDPTTLEYIPTCHRASFDSILEDVDYLAAVEHSDGVTRRQYQKDAAKIAEVQRGILATSQKEEPFDVFICYKELDENGERTRDSLMAQDIYYQLTEQGRRVFFARITLEDKVGAEYEPYIFAALNSAKVMIVVTTSAAYVNSVWVKNEWSRFLALLKKDKSRLLLPCYRDMDPYDLPEQLSVLQSYDMGKIGFIQDLTRGVAKVLDADKPKEKETTIIREGAGVGNAASLLKRGYMFLEDKDWNSANEYFEKVLDIEPENGQAYFGKFLVSKRVRNADEYVSSATQLSEIAERKKKKLEACPWQKEQIEAAIQKYTVPDYLEAQKIRDAFKFDRTYTSLTEVREQELSDARDTLTHNKNLARAVQYANPELSDTLRGMCNTIIETLQKRVDSEKEKDGQKTAKITADYKEYLAKVEQTVAKEHAQALERKAADEQAVEQEREEKYQDACHQQEKAAASADFMSVAEIFKELGDYKDSAQRVEACNEKAVERLTEEDRTKALHAAQKKKKAIIWGIIALLVFSGILVFLQVILPARRYSTAEQLMQQGEYEAAAKGFEAMGLYKDSSQKILEAQYANAEALFAAGKYDEAAKAFTALEEYNDSAQRAQEANDEKNYAEAEALFDAGKYEEAITVFKGLGKYSDSAQLIEEAYYKNAESLLASGNKAGAAMAFIQAGTYLDAQSRAKPLWEEITQGNPMSAGTNHALAVKSDGTVVTAGSNEDGECDVSGWSSIASVAGGTCHSVGLKTDGSVVAVGGNDDGQCNVSDWTDIVEVAAGLGHTVGLKEDGTVVAAGDNEDGQCDVSAWSNIVQICAGHYQTLGLKSDGTVVATGSTDDGQCDVSDWKDITAISSGTRHSVGLKSDGTVVATGENNNGQCDVADWSNIVAVSAGCFHTVGLKSDGTVIAIGYNVYGPCDVSDWSNIVAVSAGGDYTIGLKSDGTVVTTGNDVFSGWKGIRLPANS